MFSSDPTDGQGQFQIAGLAGASYELGVETDGRLYLAEAPAILAPGQSRNVHVAIDPQSDPQPGQVTKPARGKGGILSNPVTAVLIVAGSAALVAGVISALDDDDDPVSPAMP